MYKVAVITMGIRLDDEKGYTRFRSVCEFLADAGYQVDLITTTFQHWEKAQRDLEKIKNEKYKFGVKFIYEPGYKKNIDLRRIYSHRIAAKNLMNLLEKEGDYDLLYAEIPPNDVALAAAEYAKKKGIPFVADVNDLWPEAMRMIIDIPVISDIIFYSLLRDAEKVYRLASGVIGTSDEYRDRPFKRRNRDIPRETVYVGNELTVFDAGAAQRTAEIVKDKEEFWVSYAGTIGTSYDIRTMVLAGEELAKRGMPQIKIKILGGGPILPPALIAVTVSMTIFPLSTGLMVSLDPFCPLENIDIEFMDRKPNFWALIPLYCEMLMSSERIPEDYDMSHLRTIGAGAEAMNDRKYAEVEEFFHKHNVQAKLSAGYGQSEGCSNLTLPNPMFPLEDGCVGMPMTATVLGVFDKDLNELNYGESGELCMTGPSMMLHYSGWRGEELTEQTLVEHPDGNTWLHTGDEAYITEQGIVHILGRGEIKAYGDKPLHVMRMETKTVRTPGVKDGFFCLVPDQEHEGYYRPYLFVILDGTKTLEEVAELLKDTLEEHEYPVEIREITERPYFHFKTDRKGLTAQILKELEQAKEEK